MFFYRVLWTACLLFNLLHFGRANEASDTTYIMKASEFYNFTNTPNSYTIVKFFTNWCSHCKTLKPIYEEVASVFNLENSADVKPKVNFVEVNCEVFGNSLCSGLPGYPMIHIIKPKEESNVLDIDERGIQENESIWMRIYQKFWQSKPDPNMTIAKDRIVQFEGSRDASTISNVIRTIISKDIDERTVKTVLNPNEVCDAANELCLLGKYYMEELQERKAISQITNSYELNKENLVKERSRLQNMERNVEVVAEGDETTSKIRHLKFLSTVLNHLEDSTISDIHDEL